MVGAPREGSSFPFWKIVCCECNIIPHHHKTFVVFVIDFVVLFVREGGESVGFADRLDNKILFPITGSRKCGLMFYTCIQGKEY